MWSKIYIKMILFFLAYSNGGCHFNNLEMLLSVSDLFGCLLLDGCGNHSQDLGTKV